MPVFEKIEDVKEFLKNRWNFTMLDVIDGLKNSNLNIVPKSNIEDKNNTMIFTVRFEKIKKR